MPSRPPRRSRSRLPRAPRSTHTQNTGPDTSRLTFTYRPTGEHRRYRWWVDRNYRMYAPGRLPGETDEARAERLGLDAWYESQGQGQDQPAPEPSVQAERAWPQSPPEPLESVEPLEIAHATLAPQPEFAAPQLTLEPRLRRSDPLLATPADQRSEAHDSARQSIGAHASRSAPVTLGTTAGPILAIVLTTFTSQALGHLGVRILTALTHILDIPLLRPGAPWVAGQERKPAPCILSLDALLRLMHGLEDDPIWNHAAVPVTSEALERVWTLLLEFSRIQIGGSITVPAQPHGGAVHEWRTSPLVNIVDTNLGTKRDRQPGTPLWVRVELPWETWLEHTLL